MKLKDAIIAVLQDAGGPLHSREIYRRIAERKLWTTTGITPADTVSARLATNRDLFERTSPGHYRLVESRPDPGSETAISESVPVASETTAADGSHTFLDAAFVILSEPENQNGLHYRDITEIAIKRSLITTAGLTPKASMSAQLGSDIAKREASGAEQRFAKIGRGVYALAEPADRSLQSVVEENNNRVREALLVRLKLTDPDQFEGIIAVLLQKLGFEDVVQTARSNDGGVDVFANLVVAGVIRTRMAIQVKRYANNVQRPTVQQVRGSLGVHDQGLIITTGGFSSGAIQEAEKPNAVRVSLMNGHQLVEQLIEFGIGVNKTSVKILDLADDPVTSTED